MSQAEDAPTTPSRRDFLKTSDRGRGGRRLRARARGLGRGQRHDPRRPDRLRRPRHRRGGQRLTAAPGVKLVAMGDAFKDRLEQSQGAAPARTRSWPPLIDVPAERSFVGLDSYEKVLATDADYVILATPPGFRPEHLQAAVAAGKNIFTEKPVAVDGPGIRAVLETYEEAKAKNLAIVGGTQRRHGNGYVETMKRIHDGAIGDLVSARCYWNQGALWNKPRQAEWSDLEWQMRNWLYFTWLSGDHIVEQHIHNLDVVNWAMNAHPGEGARPGRPAGAHGAGMGPHLRPLHHRLRVPERRAHAEHVPPDPGHRRPRGRGPAGHAGHLRDLAGRQALRDHRQERLAARPEAWANDPYVQEHIDLIASIRAGKPLNELKTVAESTLTAIMGRMSAYTGPVGDLGAGAQLAGGAGASRRARWPGDRCRCRRWRSRARPSWSSRVLRRFLVGGLLLLQPAPRPAGARPSRSRGHEFAEPHMGTTFRVVLYAASADAARRAARAAFARVAELDARPQRLQAPTAS